MKHNKKIKRIKTLITLVIVMISISSVAGQVHPEKINYKFRAKTYKIEYKKINDLRDFNSLEKAEWPLFLIDSFNIKQIKATTRLLERLDLKNAVLKNNDSITKAVEAEYEHIIKTQEDRVSLYKDAYEQLRTINGDLNEQIDIAVEIGRKSGRRGRFNSVIYGVLGGLVTGITIGVVVGN